VFPRGDVEPDPEISHGGPELIGDWSRSVEIMLRKAPGTRLLVAVASGALSPRFARNPLVMIRRTEARRQKLAETLQFIRQVTRPGSVPLDIHLSFAEPVAGAELLAKGAMPEVAAIARRLLAGHMEALRSWPDGG
jgi:hypothetical protein